MRRIEQAVDRQIALLENHQQHGVLDRLGFAIEMDLPKSSRGSDGKRYAVAEVPPGRIPYIPVVDAWFVSLALAEVLATLFERDNAGKGIEFYPAICTVSLMDEEMYVYGSDSEELKSELSIDTICMECGGIVQLPASQQPDHDYFCCNDCLNAIAKQM